MAASVNDLMIQWIQEQQIVAEQVVIRPSDETTSRFSLYRPSFNENALVGGVDVSFSTVNGSNLAVAVYVVLERSSGDQEAPVVVYEDHLWYDVSVPYVPSFLAFREIDPMVTLIERQKNQAPKWTPQVILVDGNGAWHPRRAGLACFVGVRTGIPTIGVGKNLYCEGGLTKHFVLSRLQDSLEDWKRYMIKEDPRDADGDGVWLDQRPIQALTGVDAQSISKQVHIDNSTLKLLKRSHGLAVPVRCDDVVLGCALVGHGAAKTRVPLFVSVGHNLSLQDAVANTARWAHARIPDPIRQADLRGRELLRQREARGES